MDGDARSTGESRSGAACGGTEALVGGAKRGDREALEALLEAHLDDVRAFVRLQLDPRVRVRESTSDVVQSVCREVLEGLGRFEYRGVGSFRAWLFTAALAKVRGKGRFHRAEKRDVGREEDAPVSAEGEGRIYSGLLSPEASPSEGAIGHECALSIERAMDTLSSDHREILLLARVVGLTHREIAQRTGRTERAVRSLVHRATVALLAAFEGRV